MDARTSRRQTAGFRECSASCRRRRAGREPGRRGNALPAAPAGGRDVRRTTRRPVPQRAAVSRLVAPGAAADPRPPRSDRKRSRPGETPGNDEPLLQVVRDAAAFSPREAVGQEEDAERAHRHGQGIPGKARSDQGYPPGRQKSPGPGRLAGSLHRGARGPIHREHGPGPTRESPSFRRTGNKRSSARCSCGAGRRAVRTARCPSRSMRWPVSSPDFAGAAGEVGSEETRRAGPDHRRMAPRDGLPGTRRDNWPISSRATIER